jgi:hypothetical protein
MSDTEAQGSEMARLLRQICEEYESAKLGIAGLACGTSQHQIITQKMENIGKFHDELRTIVGDTAMALIVEQLSTFPDANGPSVQ